MLKSCGARGVGVAGLVGEENMKQARALGSGADALPTESMPHGLLVEGIGLENPFL
jgi:hypothetical protein